MLRPNLKTTKLSKRPDRKDITRNRLKEAREMHEFYHGKSENSITKTMNYKIRSKAMEEKRKNRIR